MDNCKEKTKVNQKHTKIFCTSEQVKFRGATDILIVKYEFAHLHCILGNQLILF